MHVEGVRNGGSFQWVQFLDPSPELLARFETAGDIAADWQNLEPQFT
jgi:hypothetical protein